MKEDKSIILVLLTLSILVYVFGEGIFYILAAHSSRDFKKGERVYCKVDSIFYAPYTIIDKKGKELLIKDADGKTFWRYTNRWMCK